MQVNRTIPLLFVIVAFALPFTCNAQETFVGDSILSVQLQYAQGLLQSGNPYDAVTECERLLFFDQSGRFTRQALILQAEAYTQGGKYRDAARSLEKALPASQGIDELRETQFALISTYLLSRNMPAAYRVLDAMSQNQQNQAILPRVYYWYGWSKIFDDQWEEAAGYFARCDSAKYLKNFCLDVHNKKYPVSFIKLISLVLPGSGSIYTGHYLSGALSLGWNALFGYLTVHALQQQRVLDALLIGDLLLLRFYTGSIDNAEKYAIDKNNEIHTNALHFLETDFQGAKP